MLMFRHKNEMPPRSLGRAAILPDDTKTIPRLSFPWEATGGPGTWQAGAAFTLGFAILPGEAYFSLMFNAFEFSLPSTGTKVPAGPDWLHEIKYDGYRIRVERDRDRVRLITRSGYDWTSRFPWIGEAALKNRVRQFVIDGEAVVLGVDGYSDFNALHSGRHNDEVQLCAFDVLAMDGDDLRNLPQRHFAAAQQLGRFWREADINRQAEPAGLVANDPTATWNRINAEPG
jgi:hypothetical protein